MKRYLRYVACLAMIMVFTACSEIQNLIPVQPKAGPVVTGATTSGLSGSPTVDLVSLSWEFEETADIEAIQIRRSDSSAPQTIFDGDLVYLNSGGTSFEDAGVTSNTTYHYSIFTRDSQDQWGIQESISSKTKTVTEAMRKLVQDIQAYAVASDPSFLVVVGGGVELTTDDGLSSGNLLPGYMASIDALLQRSVYFSPTDVTETPAPMEAYLDKIKNTGAKPIMVMDFATSGGNISTSAIASQTKGYISFQRPVTMTALPSDPGATTPTDVHSGNVTNLTAAQNFVVVEAPFTNHLTDIAASNYDVIVMDIFQTDQSDAGNVVLSTQVNSLRSKGNLGNRLVLAYLDIGTISDQYYYWDSAWDTTPESWIGASIIGTDRYRTHYWNADWQTILFGNDSSFMKKILDAGFDGVLLDNLDEHKAH
ncbi:hypothetical protein HOH87_07825 [bacterium]|jgi:cysteinyl-tRNA synthetase, unknown class|nr:hypothetical protein [bacterium]